MSVATLPRTMRTRPRPDGWDYDTFQRQRVATYQAELAAAGGDRRAVSPAGRAALADLLEDLDGLLRYTVARLLEQRFGRSAPDGLFDDCLSEALAACIEAAPSYDPTRGKKVSGYFLDTRSAGGPARKAILGVIQRATRGVELTDEQETVVRYAHAVIGDFRARGVEPSIAQVEQETQARCHDYQRRKVFEKWVREDRALPEPGTPEWDQVSAEADTIAARRLSQDKYAGPLREVWDLLVLSQQQMPFDADVTRDLEASAPAPADDANDDVSDLARVAVCGMTTSDRQLVWAYLAGDGAGTARGAGSPAEQRRGRARIAELMAQAQANLAAPHAHFAALSPTLGIQFEEPTHAGGAIDRLTAAVRAARD